MTDYTHPPYTAESLDALSDAQLDRMVAEALGWSLGRGVNNGH